MFKRGLAGLVLAVALVATSCGGSGDPVGSDRLELVVTTTILGDLVRNVVDGAAAVRVLIPAGADPHDFHASARQVAAIVSADLVITNGLSLEEGLDDVLETALRDGANILELGEMLEPQRFMGTGAAGSLDPHFWLDPLRMADAAELVAAELSTLAPGDEWTEQAASYAARLRSTDQEIESILEAVPEANRMLVTNHDSLGYFATRYGFEVVGVVIGGGSPLADPSSAELADLVAVVDQRGVSAIFAETTDSRALAEAVAAEVGREVAVVEVYTGSLGDAGSGAETLIDMLIANARRIAAALG